MTYLDKVETYGVDDKKYSLQWGELSEEDRSEIFLIAAEMDDVDKRRDVVEMTFREVAEAVSEATLQGMVTHLFEMMEPIPNDDEAVRRAEGGGQQ